MGNNYLRFRSALKYSKLTGNVKPIDTELKMQKFSQIPDL